MDDFHEASEGESYGKEDIGIGFKSYFEKYVPGHLAEVEISAPEGTAIGDLLHDLGISLQTPLLLLVNGTAQPRSYILQASDELTLLQLMDGG